ncbi:MAG TPA: TonB-dependent receptor [Caulobacteraceae bacterium]|nr:TonB-dependent receptor [Caulobacteraceae bacterium]
MPADAEPTTALPERVALAALALALAAAPAFAETAPSTGDAPASKPAPTASEVTVTAPQEPVKTSIDRRSYDVTKDLQGGTGSVADVLRNVPEVSVDLDGNVSLRGDRGVTILVDGKPSTLFSGPGSGQALVSIPAGQFARVEVLTNPTAALRPDGSGGVINLVTRRTAPPGTTGTIRITGGPDGRWNTGLVLNRKDRKLTVSAFAGVRHDVDRYDTRDLQTSLGPAGDVTSTVDDTSHGDGTRNSGYVRLAADYDPDARTRLSAILTAFGSASETDSSDHRVGRDGLGDVNNLYDTAGRQRFGFDSESFEADWRRTFAGQDHDLVVSLQQSRNANDSRGQTANSIALPAAAPTFDRRRRTDVFNETTLKADFRTPRPGGGELKAGLDVQWEADSLDNDAVNGAAAADSPFDPGQHDRFDFDRAIAALYSTYERPFGRFTVLGGLRFEATHLAFGQAGSAGRTVRDEARLYPTLHLGWRFDAKRQLVFSYSQRVSRPAAPSYDPFVFAYGPFYRSRGNPGLEPQRTDQYELRFDMERGGRAYALSGYYRRSQGGVTDVLTDLGGGVLLSTSANLVSSRSAGAELTASGKLGRTLTLNLGVHGGWTEIDASAAAQLAHREGLGAGGNLTLGWQASRKDLIQLDVHVMQAEVGAQGVSPASAYANIGWRHKFSDKLSLVVSAVDVAASSNSTTRIDTAALKQTSRFDSHRRTAFVSLVLGFGQGPKRAPDFDFETGGR